MNQWQWVDIYFILFSILVQKPAPQDGKGQGTHLSPFLVSYQTFQIRPFLYDITRMNEQQLRKPQIRDRLQLLIMNDTEKSSQLQTTACILPCKLLKSSLSHHCKPHIFVAQGPQKNSSGDRQNRIQILTLHLILLVECYLSHEVTVEFLLDYVYKKCNAVPTGKSSINGIQFYRKY